MSAPAIPAGYRRLKVGEYVDYSCRYIETDWKQPEFPCTGYRVEEMPKNRIYIAPVCRRKGGKKGRAK